MTSSTSTCPQVGETVESGAVIGELESTKSVSDIFSPLSGEVMSRNEALDGGAEVINSDPYGEGWLIKVRTSDEDATESLLDSRGVRSTRLRVSGSSPSVLLGATFETECRTRPTKPSPSRADAGVIADVIVG